MLKLIVRRHGVEIKSIELTPGCEYIVGRGDNCDIILDESPGISRQHFRIYDDNGVWRLSVLSKFGTVLHNGIAVGDIELDNEVAFKLALYDFQCQTWGLSQQAEPFANEAQQADPSLQQVTTEQDHQESEFEGNDEETRIAKTESVPYLRVLLSPNSDEDVLRLEGHSWTVGRDETCTVCLQNPKVSRRQFRLDSDEDGFFVTDLGSSNGTSLNGSLLKPNEPTSLRSGDLLTVQNVTIYFELRDPGFKNKLMVIPESVRRPPALAMGNDNALVPMQNGYQYPYMNAHHNGNGGAVPIGYDRQFHPALQPYVQNWRAMDGGRRKKIYAIIAVVFILGAYSLNSGSPAKPVQPQITVGSQFSKLSPQEQQLVKDSYNLAKNLHLQHKYELAKVELQKVSELLHGEPYLDSATLIADCDEAYNNQLKALEIEKMHQEAERNRLRVTEVLDKCAPVSERSVSVDEITNCLNDARMIDPENVYITAQIDKVTKRVELAKAKKAERDALQNRISQTRSLFKKAVDQQQQGDLLAAIATFQALIDSSLPDPSDLKGTAKRQVASIKQNISSDVDQHLKKAQQLFEAANFKDSLAEIDRTKKLDPGNAAVHDLGKKVERELTAQLQELYSNSVLDEGLGNIEPAKEKWRKIIELDRPGADYYKRARNKLRTYGSP